MKLFRKLLYADTKEKFDPAEDNFFSIRSFEKEHEYY